MTIWDCLNDGATVCFLVKASTGLYLGPESLCEPRRASDLEWVSRDEAFAHVAWDHTKEPPTIKLDEAEKEAIQTAKEARKVLPKGVAVFVVRITTSIKEEPL